MTVFERYAEVGLDRLVRQIRAPGRYGTYNGVNVLTNAVSPDCFDRQLVLVELRAAEEARLLDAQGYLPQLPAQHGLSFGLNPYTDWALSQLTRAPDHWYLFLGLDWYSVGELVPPGETGRWFDYIANPFIFPDSYWRNLWNWIAGRCDQHVGAKGNWDAGSIATEDASRFIREDGGGFVFHNLIPYLRPPSSASSSTNWPEIESRRRAVRDDVRDDLRLLRQITGGRIVVFCTSNSTKDFVESAGYPSETVVSWGRHPSRLFYAGHFRRRNLWFNGTTIEGSRP